MRPQASQVTVPIEPDMFGLKGAVIHCTERTQVLNHISVLQFPGGSDNYLTISGAGHPFLSSEVGIMILEACTVSILHIIDIVQCIYT